MVFSHRLACSSGCARACDFSGGLCCRFWGISLSGSWWICLDASRSSPVPPGMVIVSHFCRLVCLVTISCACCILSWMSEDAFFRLLSSTSSQGSPVDFVRMSSLAVPHRLGLGLEGFRASDSKLIQFCPIASLVRVCLPECSFPWPGPRRLFACLISGCIGLVSCLFVSLFPGCGYHFGSCGIVRAESSEGLHHGLQASLSEVLAVSTLIQSFLHLSNSAALSLGRFSSRGIDVSFLDFRCAWWLCFLGSFVSVALFIEIFLCLYSVSQDFSIFATGAVEAHIFTHGRSLAGVVMMFSPKVCPHFLSVTQVGNPVCQVCTFPSVCLPHRCLLDASRAPMIHYVVATCVGPLISRIGLALFVSFFSFCRSVLPSPEDRLYLLSAWHGRLVANELEISLVDSAADFGASHALVRDRIVWRLRLLFCSFVDLSMPGLFLLLCGVAIFLFSCLMC